LRAEIGRGCSPPRTRSLELLESVGCSALDRCHGGVAERLAIRGAVAVTRLRRAADRRASARRARCRAATSMAAAIACAIFLRSTRRADA
jgi:hypothetical protein